MDPQDMFLDVFPHHAHAHHMGMSSPEYGCTFVATLTLPNIQKGPFTST